MYLYFINSNFPARVSSLYSTGELLCSGKTSTQATHTAETIQIYCLASQ